MAKRGTFSHIIPENRGKCNVRAGESPKNQPAPSYPVKNLRPSEVRCYLRSHSKLVVLAFHPVTKQTRTWEVKCMSCLENPRDRGAWWAVVSGVAQSQTRLKRLSSSSSSRQRQACRKGGLTEETSFVLLCPTCIVIRGVISNVYIIQVVSCLKAFNGFPLDRMKIKFLWNGQSSSSCRAV